MINAVKSAASHLEGTSGYTCVANKGHLDNCKDPNGVCETNSICKLIDDIKRRGKLDKTEVIYSEANNIENGTNAKSSFELLFELDYDGDDIEIIAKYISNEVMENYIIKKIDDEDK